VFQRDALTLTVAWQKFDLLMSNPRVTFVDEPAGIQQHWRSFTDRQSFSPHVWNDAYSAALAICANLELVTFDKSMTQYKAAPCNVLA
jgi:predicted nucleic acid-binding protein